MAGFGARTRLQGEYLASHTVLETRIDPEEDAL
jgi:hypothetical protein